MAEKYLVRFEEVEGVGGGGFGGGGSGILGNGTTVRCRGLESDNGHTRRGANLSGNSSGDGERGESEEERLLKYSRTRSSPKLNTFSTLSLLIR